MILQIIVLVLFLITWIKALSILFQEFNERIYCLCDQKKRNFLWRPYHSYYKFSSIVMRLVITSVIAYLIGLQYVNMLIVKNEYYESYVFELVFYNVVFFLPYTFCALFGKTSNFYSKFQMSESKQGDPYYNNKNNDKYLSEFIDNMRAEPRYYEKHY